MMRCAIYARVSTDLQKDTSVVDQEAACRAYVAKQDGWIVLDAHVYTEQPQSASSFDGRPKIQALMTAAASEPRPFDVVLVDDSSRIARDLADAWRFLQMVKFFRVRAIFVSQGIDTDHAQASTLVALRGIVDSLYLTDLASKIKRGLAGQLGRGFATGGRTYGYRTEAVLDPSGKTKPDGTPGVAGYRLVTDDHEAAVVRRIFERYADGQGVRNIVVELNAAAVPGPRHGAWKHGAVNRILRNPKYDGVQTWGRTRVERKPGTAQKVARPVPREEWQTRADESLRVVSHALWERVQRRLAQVRTAVARQPKSTLMRGRNAALHSTHLFSGLSRCGICGNAVTVVCGGHGSPRYGCQHSWRNGQAACANRQTIRAKVADASLLAGVQAYLLREDTLTYLTDAVSTGVTAALRSSGRTRVSLERERQQTAAKLQRLVAAVETGGATSTVMATIRSREADLTRLDHELEALERPQTPPLARSSTAHDEVSAVGGSGYRHGRC